VMVIRFRRTSVLVLNHAIDEALLLCRRANGVGSESPKDELRRRYFDILTTICKLANEEADLIEPQFTALENELCRLEAVELGRIRQSSRLYQAGSNRGAKEFNRVSDVEFGHDTASMACRGLERNS